MPGQHRRSLAPVTLPGKDMFGRMPQASVTPPTGEVMVTHPGMPPAYDPSHPQPLERDGFIAAFLAAAQPVPPPTSLVTTETTVRIDPDRYLAERGTAEEFKRPADLDENSLSSNFRHSGWRVTRRRVFDSLARTGQNPARRRSFGECGSFTTVQQSAEDPTKFRVRCNHCHDRLCTPCANERARTIRDIVLSHLPDGGISFITLTLAGKDQGLAEKIDRLYRHFRALRAHPIWSEKVAGGVAFLEIKWNEKAKRWHPHLHLIAEAKYFDQGQLSDLWRGITQDSFIVDISRVKDKNSCGSYVAKYASKPLNMSFANSPILLDEAVTALKGRRLVFAFGNWYGTKLSSLDDDEFDLEADNAGWHHFAHLEDLLLAARSGERDATNVLRHAGLEGAFRLLLERVNGPPATGG